MRRVDRDRDRQPAPAGAPARPRQPLMSAVQDMHENAGILAPGRQDMFSRIESFQTGRTLLGFNHYAPQPPINLFRPNESRDARIAGFMEHLSSSLQQPNDMAYVQLSLESSQDRRDYGHAILIQRGADDHYSIFDPNNGAFEYRNLNATQDALRGYMDSAFSGPSHSGTGNGYEVTPFKMQAYSSLPQAARPAAPVLAPQQGQAAYGPPETDCADRIYREHASFSKGISLDMLFPDAAQRSRIHNPGESLGIYMLRIISARRPQTLSNTMDAFQDASGHPASRQEMVDHLNEAHGQYQSASVTDLLNHTRYGGSSNITSSDDLVGDLRTHFGEPYIGDGAAASLRNDFAVIDLMSWGHDAGTSRQQPGHPLIVQRLNSHPDFARDQYELYDPRSGVFRYDNFQDLSTTIGRIYDTGYFADGGTGYATTTWFAGEAANTNQYDMARGARPLSPARNVTLGESVQMGERVLTGQLAPPLADLPPEPDANRPSLQDYTRTFELKRSAVAQWTANPWVLFRPSTDTPAEVAKRGGFSAEQTPLRDVNLQTHEFDIATHGAETDSAGYLGTFQSPTAAIDRQRHQFADGYIYAIAPSPNMVDVGASLGSYARVPGNREFAAMGHIDNTQIIAWWRTEDLRAGRKEQFTRNPAFRWDVYDHTQTAKAQPQLARFPMNSPAWLEPGYMRFASSVIRDGKRIGSLPRQDPNLTQAQFHLDASLKVSQAAARQASGKDYRGPMYLRAYGGEYNYILYADAYGRPVVYSMDYASGVKGSTRQFTMGDDGRFHYANNYNKVLRVGASGYLYVDSIPRNSRNLNGVFRLVGANPYRLIHLEDSKYLNVGKSVATPFVADYYDGYRSNWKLTNSRGKAVAPPESNRNTYYRESTVGNAEQLYQFDRNPDSILPPGTTHFVTQTLVDAREGTFYRYLEYVKRRGEANFVIQSLNNNNAAWLFRDGFYAVPVAPNILEVRTLAGQPVWRATVDVNDGKETYETLGSVTSTFHINDDVWNGLRSREKNRLHIEDKLMSGS